MIYLILSITYMSSFEIGLIPNGSATIYTEEFWSEHEPIYLPVTELNIDRSGLIYYSIFNFELEFNRFFVGGGIKTYAEKLNFSKGFAPYRTKYTVKLGLILTENVQAGFTHSCTHTSINFYNIGIFEGTYEELYLRIELKRN